MEQNIENKLDFKTKIINFYHNNKIKFLCLLFILIIITILKIFVDIKTKKENTNISEKYIKAGVYLTSNDKKNAAKLYEEIILSKNKFYSLLSINALIEKKLIDENEKILNYFDIIENLNYTEEKLDLISFKKDLFLIKKYKDKEGKKILKNLIEKESKYKFLAEEIIINK